MEAQARQATSRQLAFIERLSMESGTAVDKPLSELTVNEASELISALLEKAGIGQNGERRTVMKGNGKRKNDFGSGARLGMAFKCVYRKWASNGADIFNHRDNFIGTVLETYKLINEIAGKALETPA